MTRRYAYCVHPDAFQRHARGFVLAANLTEAKAKAKKRVQRERRKFARWANIDVKCLPPMARTYRVRVWRDDAMTTAPLCHHYCERN